MHMFTFGCITISEGGKGFSCVMIKHVSGCLSFVPFQILPAVIGENISGEETVQQGQTNTRFSSSLFVSCLW